MIRIPQFNLPGQVFGIKVENGATQILNTGWMLFIHPDFLWNTPLSNNIKQHEYFSYSVHEALFLSEREEAIITAMMQNMDQEYRSSIDKFSQDIIIAQTELLLTYAERFYQRQFITRKIANHQLLSRLEEVLNAYVNSYSLSIKGLPSVQFIADTLNVSPGYLRNSLKR